MSVSDDAGAEFREVGHRLIDLLADYLDGIEELDVFPEAAPAELESLFSEPLPPGGMGDRAGIGGDGAAGGSLAVRPRRLRRSRGRDPDERRHAGQLIGLKLARDAVSGDRAQHEGVVGGWAVYTSDERHVAIDKAVDAVGLGRESLRVVATDDAFRIELAALEEAIARDRAAGVRPFCLVAVGGSTNTGAADPLGDLRRIADREGAWLHVDAAYGAAMLLTSEGRDVLADLELADSVAVDPHKWFFAPVDAGAILVRDASQLPRSFGMEPAYLADELDAAGERYQYFVHGFEQSRRFRALKVW